MTLCILRDDALRSANEGFALRVSLPWIRSLPLWCVSDLSLSVDGRELSAVTVGIGDRRVAPSALAFEESWWFVQDRLVLHGREELAPGAHHVVLAFQLAIPYLDAGPDRPLHLPFRAHRPLVLDAPVAASVSRDIA